MLKKLFRQKRDFSNTTSSDRGRHAEQAAEAYLNKKGLHCIERNYRCRFGEIDLIMQGRQGQTHQCDTLIFVEVRFRKHSEWGDGANSVDFRKQRKLIRTAEHFLQHHSLLQSLPCRFDVVSIGYGSSDKFNYQFDWIQNAFSAD